MMKGETAWGVAQSDAVSAMTVVARAQRKRSAGPGNLADQTANRFRIYDDTPAPKCWHGLFRGHARPCDAKP
jgi:hypothetical protein